MKALVVLIILWTGSAFAQDKSVVNLGTTVTGNQEQPKVLYIVPWQPAEDNAILYQPLKSKTDKLFKHVERDEHKRYVKFLNEMEHE